MDQVMVEELSQGWIEPDPRITETYAEQPIATQEDDEYMSYLSHYVVQGDQHIPVYQTASVNAKAESPLQGHARMRCEPALSCLSSWRMPNMPISL